MALPRITFSTVLKLIVASLLVGFALAIFDVTPGDIIDWARGTLSDVLTNTSAYFQSALSYVLLGAVIVVPIWLISYLWRAARGKN